jgi:hypothetical protein
MNDWQKDWQTALERFAEGVEQVCQTVAQDVTDAVDHWAAFSEDLIEELDRAIAPGLNEFDQQMTAWSEALVQWVTEMEQAIAPEAVPRPGHSLEDQGDRPSSSADAWTEWADSLFIQLFVDLEVNVGQAAEPMMHTLEPMLNEHPACVGCRNYHGYAYNGVPFVCAMHPYGWEAGDRSCPDWESTWERLREGD